MWPRPMWESASVAQAENVLWMSEKLTVPHVSSGAQTSWYGSCRPGPRRTDGQRLGFSSARRDAAAASRRAASCGMQADRGARGVGRRPGWSLPWRGSGAGPEVWTRELAEFFCSSSLRSMRRATAWLKQAEKGPSVANRLGRINSSGTEATGDSNDSRRLKVRCFVGLSCDAVAS